MEKLEENKLRMISAVLNVFAMFTAIWNNNIGLKSLIDKLTGFYDEITGIRPMADAKTNGITMEKETLKDDVVDSILEVAGPLTTIAKNNGNMDLAVKVNVPEYSLRRLHEPKLADLGIEIARLAFENQAELVKFGISQEDVIHLDAISKEFKAKVPKGRLTISLRKASKESRIELMKKASELLNDLDKTMQVYRRKNPEFFNAYFFARGIIEYGIRHEEKTDVQTSNNAS